MERMHPQSHVFMSSTVKFACAATHSLLWNCKLQYFVCIYCLSHIRCIWLSCTTKAAQTTVQNINNHDWDCHMHSLFAVFCCGIAGIVHKSTCSRRFAIIKREIQTDYQSSSVILKLCQNFFLQTEWVVWIGTASYPTFSKCTNGLTSIISMWSLHCKRAAGCNIKLRTVDSIFTCNLSHANFRIHAILTDKILAHFLREGLQCAQLPLKQLSTESITCM